MNHPALPSFPGDPLYNDALFLYGAVQPLPFVLAYVQELLEVVHGPACKPEQEVFLDRCAADHVPVLRRRGGGGTVVLSPGMVVTLVVGERRAPESIADIHNRVHGPLSGILSGLTGTPVRPMGVSDLTIDGRKILGSSLYLGRDPFLFYYQSSLLVESDIALLGRYLGSPPREPDYRAGRTHDTFCTTMKKEGCPLSAQRVAVEIGRLLRARMAADR